MPRKPDRKMRDLRAAVVRSGQTMEGFARKLGVSAWHVREVARKRRESPRVEQAIEDLIQKQLPGAEVS